jgi:hypothetical protein
LSSLLCFARDPFADVWGAVSEFDAPRFAQCQEGHNIAVDEADLPEIDGDGAAFPIDHGTKDVNVVLCNPPTDAEYQAPLTGESVDSEGHRAWQLVRASCAPPNKD